MYKQNLVIWLIVSVVMVGIIFFARWFFNAVIASDLPDWVKYLLLRG